MDTAAKSSPAASNGWTDSLAAWKRRNLHQVVLPSGAHVVVQRTELMPLVLANAVPDDFAELARTEITDELGVVGGFAKQLAAAQAEETPESPQKVLELTERFSGLLKWLVAEHVLVEPKLTVAELSDADFPLEDLDWLYGFATRRVNEDALGRRLGVARLDEWATFREKHGCPADCEHCFATLEAHSTADLGAL